MCSTFGDFGHFWSSFSFGSGSAGDGSLMLVVEGAGTPISRDPSLHGAYTGPTRGLHEAYTRPTRGLHGAYTAPHGGLHKPCV